MVPIAHFSAVARYASQRQRTNNSVSLIEQQEVENMKYLDNDERQSAAQQQTVVERSKAPVNLAR